MGFFDRIKSTVSQMTGNSANVQLQLGSFNVQRGQAINFTAYLNATGPLKAKSVNTELRAVEIVEFDVPVRTSANEEITSSTRTERQTKENETYRNMQPID